MRVHTALVTRPRTGFPYLDAGLEQPGTVLAMAHRGGALHPDILEFENTLAAFENATSLGYRYLETDVQATRDGVLLAFHDACLDRMTDREGAVADLTYAEVAAARIGGTEQVATMAGLLERFPEARFNIDIKAPSAIRPLAELVARTRSEDRVCVGSFSERSIAAFRRLAGPRVATACGPVSVVVRRLLTGLPTRTLARRGNVLQVPPRLGPLPLVTGPFVASAHRAGLPVHVWTVNDPAEMERLLDAGADGLFTDRIDLLRDLLVDRGQWWQEADS